MHDLLGGFEEHSEVKKQMLGVKGPAKKKGANAKEFDESLDQRMEENETYMQELEDWVQNQ